MDERLPGQDFAQSCIRLAPACAAMDIGRVLVPPRRMSRVTDRPRVLMTDAMSLLEEPGDLLLHRPACCAEMWCQAPPEEQFIASVKRACQLDACSLPVAGVTGGTAARTGDI